jgi:hypothetical protein
LDKRESSGGKQATEVLLKKVVLPSLDPSAFPVKLIFVDGTSLPQADLTRLQGQALHCLTQLRSCTRSNL